MFCPQCGTQNSEGSAFCKQCGSQIRVIQATQAAPAASSTRSAAPFSASSAIPLTQGATPMPGGSMVAAPVKNTRKRLIGIIAIVVIVAAAVCVYLFACSTKPVYAWTSANHYSSGELMVGFSNVRADDGTLLSQTVTLSNRTTTTEYKSIGEGVSIPATHTGRYETNSNGDITYIESYLPEKPNEKTITTFTYYSPGAIQTQSIRNETIDQIITYTYDADGWTTDQVIANSGVENHIHNEYIFARDGRSVTVVSEQDGDQQYARMVLDENGNVIEGYEIDKNGNETLTLLRSYQKIDNPSRYISALSRIKY